MLVWVLIGFGVLLILSGVLLAIAFPRLSLQWAEHETDRCQSRLRRLAQAAMAYAEDHSNRFPPAAVWMDALRPRLPADRYLRCPEYSSESGRHGYALNADLAGRALSGAADRGSTFLLYDSVNLARNASDPLTSLPPQGRHRTASGFGNNVAFADGTVRLVPTHAAASRRLNAK